MVFPKFIFEPKKMIVKKEPWRVLLDTDFSNLKLKGRATLYRL